MGGIFEAIAEAAKNAGKTIQDVEREAGLSNGSIGKWRTAQPLVGNLLKVCTVLNIDINDLLARAKELAKHGGGE